MPKTDIKYTERTEFKHEPETREQLEGLKAVTGLKKSALIRKAVAEMHERDVVRVMAQAAYDAKFKNADWWETDA